MPPDIAVADPELPALPVVPQPPLPPKSLSPDDDPNLKLQRMVSRRRAEKPTEPEKPDEKKDAKPAEPAPKGDIKKLGGEIGKALGFRTEKPVKEDETNLKDGVEAGLGGDKAVKAGKEGKESGTVDGDKARSDVGADKAATAAKTIVKPKRAAVPAPDPVKIAAAAATAAVKAAMPEARPALTAQKPEDLLKADDLHEYEVAKFLAESNPSRKDAPKIVLDHVRKSEAYAAQWEKDNKGKVFDPDDAEHDDFYAALEKPWSDHEFKQAEKAIDRAATKKELKQEYDVELKSIREENAIGSLAPVVEVVYVAAAGLLAKKIGDEVHEKIIKNTFNKFAEEDPITADAMTASIGPLKPIIEAAVQLDDPKGRVSFNPKNQNHLEWNRALLEKEAQLAGADDGSGKTMVSRGEYVSMTQAQRSQHWYLTTERFIEELVNDAAGNARQIIENENKRLEKMAASRGYVLKKADAKPEKESAAPKSEKPAKTQETEKEPAKPVSPAAGGAAKIDDKSAGNQSSTGKLLETTAGILFNR